MADVNLSTTSSIVDYLAAQKKPSDYSSREQLYNSSGLSDRLGAYTGSASQNTNLLNYLRSQETNTSTTPPASTSSGISFAPGPQSSGALTPPYASNTRPNATPMASQPWNIDPVTGNSLGSLPPPGTTTPFPVASSGGATNAYQTATEPPTPANDAFQTAGDSEMGASDAMGALGFDPSSLLQQSPINFAELTTKALNDPAFKIYQEMLGQQSQFAKQNAEVNKAALEQQFTVQKRQLEEEFGRRGLFMSGMREFDIGQLVESLASSKLNVDREMAQTLLTNDLKLRERIINDVADLVEQAITDNNTARKEALDQLNAAGYALIGNQLMPTIQKQQLMNAGADNARQMFSALVSSGGLSALSGEDAFMMASQLGLSPASFAGIQNAIAGKEKQYQSFETRELKNGQLVVLGIKPDGQIDVLKTLSGGAGGAGGGGGDLLTVQTAMDVASGRQKITDLPADLELSVRSYMAYNGMKMPRNLTASQEQASINANDGLYAAQEVANELINEDGSINRLKLQALLLPGDPFARNLANNMKIMADVLTRIRTGAALNEQEMKFYESLTPRLLDGDDVIKSKLNHFVTLYAGITGTPIILTSPDGQEFVADDMFDSAVRAEVRKAITNGWQVTGF